MKLRPLFCFPDISTKDKLRWLEQNKTMETLDFMFKFSPIFTTGMAMTFDDEKFNGAMM